MAKDSEPPRWWPRAGWGTVRDYVVVPNENGGTDVSFKFVPDDGSEPRTFVLPETGHIEKIGEYARGIMRGKDFTIKVSATSMARVESDVFPKINRLDHSKRMALFADRSDIDGDCGWTWTSDYILVKVAPGLFD